MKILFPWFILSLFLQACTANISGNRNGSVAQHNIYSEKIPVTPVPSTLPDKWWQQAVFYEVFVRSYKDSDGDGHGDIKGLISKLDYLQKLGVTGLWLMPVTESQFNANGYDVKNYRAIETDYGSMDDFKTLLDEAHKRGIGVIVDFVINHSSADHPFFWDTLKHRNSGYRDWYIWSDSNPGWKQPWNSSADVWHRGRGGYFYGLFFDFLPDWNFKNDSVKAYTKDTLKFWLNMGVDGFRFDAVTHLVENGPDAQENQPQNHLIYKEIRALTEQYSNTYIVAEAPFTGNDYLGDGNDEFNSVFCFECSQQLVYGVKNQNSKLLKSYLQAAADTQQESKYATLLSNHDPFAGLRMYSAMAGNIAKAKLAATILLTSPGIPFIYYGEEIAMASIAPSQVPWADAVSRTPMQWSAASHAGFTSGNSWRNINANYAQYNVEQQEKDPASMLNHYKKMLAIRNANPALSSGAYQIAAISGAGSDKCIVYLRSAGDNLVMVAVNTSATAQTIAIDFTGTVLENVNAAVSADLYDGAISYPNINSNSYQLTLPAYGSRLIPVSMD